MTIEPLRLHDLVAPVSREANPLSWLGPSSGSPVSVRHFTCLDEWREFVLSLYPSGNVPKLIRSNHERVLRTLYLAWIDDSVIKFAELGALANLEAAIRDRYRTKKFRGMEEALRYLFKHKPIRNSDFQVFRVSGAPVVAHLVSKDKARSGPAMSELRNWLGHGDAFEMMQRAGLFEVVRDLINLTYA